MAATDKDTIYIDIDDEITGIIDKVHNSNGKVVALVLPKRAAVFQSIVNMKLLKRAADSGKKNIVLITSEAGLLPLAGVAGVHVAKTLTSKPSIPLGPLAIDDGEETVDEEDGETIEPDLDGAASVGALAAAGGPPSDDVETLTLDDEDLPPEDMPTGPKTFDPPAKKKGKKDKKLAVPNFERFRLLLILGVVVLIIGIGGFVFANASLAKAVITVKTDATSVDVGFDMNLSTTATKLVSSNNTVPAKLATQTKTFTQQVPTTGQKNNGNKASGKISLTAGSCSGDVPAGIEAGAGLSSNGQTYITQDVVSFVPTVSKGKCIFQGVDSEGNAGVSIIAQSGGASFNVSGVTFAYSKRSDVTISGSTTGGTDNIVQIVNQNDINNAKAKITASNDSTMKAALKSQLQQEQYFAIEATYVAGTPTTTNSANVGEVANNVTVTETITYTMLGAHESDLKVLIGEVVKDQIDTSKQSITDDGLSSGTFNASNISATGAQLSFVGKAVAGPDISEDTIKQDAAGKKAGVVKDELKTNPDVTSVDIKVSPFWATSIPKDTSKITVNIAKPTSAAKASTESGDNP